MKTKLLFFTLLISIAPLVSVASESKVQSTKKEVTVEIDYGKGQSPKSVRVHWFPNITVLGALQEAAVTVTHPVGKYVFVTEIDRVNAERGKMAWYYRVNDKSPTKLALYQTVKPGDKVSWRYVEDVCSCKIDNPQKEK